MNGAHFCLRLSRKGGGTERQSTPPRYPDKGGERVQRESIPSTPLRYLDRKGGGAVQRQTVPSTPLWNPNPDRKGGGGGSQRQSTPSTPLWNPQTPGRKGGSQRQSAPSTPLWNPRIPGRKGGVRTQSAPPSRPGSPYSRREGKPIVFSHSTPRRKPVAVERMLECTLEELCFGSVQVVAFSREVLDSNGIMIEEQKTLRINVKPGWTQGTKITFEGIADERPGFLPADLIFTISEKNHNLFMREGNHLVLAVEIPLVKALTGCKLSIPLLGGDEMRCWVDEVIYPGYEKIIDGQGMPIPEENGKRGDLRVKFYIEFPTELTDDQRSKIHLLLRDCS